MPVETGGALALIYKGVALVLGASAAAYIVMAMQRPQEDKEWKQALFVTLMSSMCGGAAAIQYFEIKHWFGDFIGTMGIIGLAFVCGLPGWFLVRAVFIWQRQNEGKSITALVRELLSLKGGNQ